MILPEQGSSLPVNRKELSKASKVANLSFKKVRDKIGSKPGLSIAQFSEARKQLEGKFHPVIVDILTKTEKKLKPSQNNRAARMSASVQPPKGFGPTVTRVAQAAKQLEDSRAEFVTGRDQLLKDLQTAGVKVVIAETGGKLKSIRVQDAKGISNQSAKTLTIAINRAAAEGGFSAEAPKAPFEVFATSSQESKGSLLRSFSLSEKVAEVLSREREFTQAQRNFDRVKLASENSSKFNLINKHLESLAKTAKENLFVGFADGIPISVGVRRADSVRFPDIDPFKSRIADLELSLKTQESAPTETFLKIGNANAQDISAVPKEGFFTRVKSNLKDEEVTQLDQALSTIKRKTIESMQRTNAVAGADFTLLDFEMQKALFTAGKLTVKAGARQFKTWSTEMVSNFGESVRPYLGEIWENIQRLPNNISLNNLSPSDFRSVPGKGTRTTRSFPCSDCRPIKAVKETAATISNVVSRNAIDVARKSKTKAGKAFGQDMQGAVDIFERTRGGLTSDSKFTNLRKQIRNAQIDHAKIRFKGDSPFENLEAPAFNANGAGYSGLSQIIRSNIDNPPLNKLEKAALKTYKRVQTDLQNRLRQAGVSQEDADRLPFNIRASLTPEAADSVFVRQSGVLFNQIVDVLKKENTTQDVPGFKIIGSTNSAFRRKGVWRITRPDHRQRWQDLAK